MKSIATALLLWLIVGVTTAAAATYQYDLNGQLVLAAYTPGRVVIYTYDAAGNRTKVEVNIQTGDVNGDGKIDMADAVLILQVAIGTVSPGQAVFADIDVDGNRRLSLDDTLFILQKIAGIR